MNAPRCAPSRAFPRAARDGRVSVRRVSVRELARRGERVARRRERAAAAVRLRLAHGGGDGVVVLRLLASEHLDVAAPHAGAVLLQREVHLHGIREDHVRLAGGAPVAAHDQRVHRLEAGEKLQHVRLARVEGEPAQAHYGERFFQHEAASRAVRHRAGAEPGGHPAHHPGAEPHRVHHRRRVHRRGLARACGGVTRGGHASAQIDRSDASLFQIAIARNQKALRDYRAAARSNGCRGSNAYRESRRQARSTRVTHRRSVVSRATGCAARQARPRHRVSPVHHHVTTRDPAKQLAIDFPENQTSFKAHFCTNSTCSRRRPLHAPLPATRSRAPLAFTHRGRTRAPWRRMR